jgi:HlyD family secretion protein
MKKYRIPTYTILAILVIAAGYWFFFRDNSKTVTTYTTAAAKPGSISNTVTATGTVEPVNQVEVGTQVSGVIQKIYVDYNSIVKKGQLLAELDKTPLLAQLASSRAEFESAASALTYQEANFNRIKELFDKKAVSETDYETALYQYSNAKANYSKMTSEVNKAKTNLGYTMIYSPIDGVVLSRAVDEGQTVAASFSTPTLFTIAQDLTKMQVVANVDEADIGQVEEGQKVTFTVDAYPDDNFEGTVKQVRLLAVTNSNVVTYSVVIDAPNPELKLKPGLTASIIAYTEVVTDVITIPSKALRFTPDSSILARYKNSLVQSSPKATASLALTTKADGNSDSISKNLVWIKTGDSIQPRHVTIGLTDETNVEIKEGIKEGELVIVSAAPLSSKASKSAATTTSSPFMPKRPTKSK